MADLSHRQDRGHAPQGAWPSSLRFAPHLLAGFTLIELMIVVAIIGLLAAIAVPQYQAFVARTKVSEGISIFAVAKTHLSETYLANGAMPATAQGQGLLPAATGNHVQQFTYAYVNDTTSTIDIVYNDLDGAAGVMNAGDLIRFTASGGSATEIQWSCTTGSTVPNAYRPAICR